MRFVFATDLHGSINKFEDVLKYTIENNIPILHLGADILPKYHRGGSLCYAQKHFIEGYLKEFYQRATEHNIKVLASFGNDDLWTLRPLIKDLVDTWDVFSAYSYVPDYPFGLKTACKIDHDGWQRPEYISTPVEFDHEFYEIKDVEKYFREKGTIEQDLNQFVPTPIISIHAPPSGCSLDVCADRREVGSNAIRRFIQRTQPKLILAGHIHESYDVTKVWKSQIGETLVIQPGQLRHTTLVDIIFEKKIEAKRIEI